ncbi:MEDS domain-containing protein [Streptomyces sp. NPDC002886]|uniref:MEDS domain-containing protein n=1 Tax=Streptomyces sp. NPDC002886 TaxID=3364667 RepID=UPI003681C899
MAALDEVVLGDHVCWFTEPSATLYYSDMRAYLADGALYGDKVVVIRSSGGAAFSRDWVPANSVVLDLPGSAAAESVVTAARREVRTAVRQGFRSVRVLAERPPATAPGGVEELLDWELRLDAFAAESGAIVVCAFRPMLWEAPALERVACVHPHEVGRRAVRPAFRMFSTGADEWSVDGVIDSEGADAFNAAVRAALAHSQAMTLRFDALEMIDAAGMHALVDAGRHLPDRRIFVAGANETVRLCWNLAGYASSRVPVVLTP